MLSLSHGPAVPCVATGVQVSPVTPEEVAAARGSALSADRPDEAEGGADAVDSDNKGEGDDLAEGAGEGGLEGLDSEKPEAAGELELEELP